MSVPEESIKILITTRPGHDGFGDLYSAKRLQRLIQEIHPEWDIRLYALRTIPSHATKARMKYIEEMNKRCDELGLASSDEVIKFNPAMHISIAGWDAGDFLGSRRDAVHETNPIDHCKQIEHTIRVCEYMYGAELMKVPEVEKKAMVSLTTLGNNLPTEIREKIHTGDYFFAYGKKSTVNYIRQIIDHEKSHPIYIVVPGLRAFDGLDDLSNTIQYDINTGQIIRQTGELDYVAKGDDFVTIDKGGDRVDTIILRGALPQNVFMTLLYGTQKPHVMVTGDMSFTEALDAKKIPFLDWSSGSHTQALYGEYNGVFINFCAGSRPMNDQGMRLLSRSSSDEIKKIQEYIHTRYLERSISAEEVSRNIESFLAAKVKLVKSPIRVSELQPAKEVEDDNLMKPKLR